MSEQCPNLFYKLAIAACKVYGWCDHYGDYKSCPKYINKKKREKPND